jgi:hypothetical protein
MDMISVYIKTLSGDIITTELNKKENGIALRKRIQEIEPDFEWQRQILIPEKNYILDSTILVDSAQLFQLQDLSNVQEGDILFLFILDPFTEYIRYTGTIVAKVSIFEVNPNHIDSFTFFSDNRYEKNNLFLYKDKVTNKISYTLNEWFDTITELIDSYHKWCIDMPHKKLSPDTIRILLHLWRIYN